MIKEDFLGAFIHISKTLYPFCPVILLHLHRITKGTMKYKLILILLIFTIQADAIAYKVDSLLKVLDKVLLEGESYMLQKENRISRLKNQRINETSYDKIFELGYLIIDEYKSYNCDSALIYIDQNLQLADEMDNTIWKIRTQLQYSFVLSSSGLFIEALENIHSIPKEKLSKDLLGEYYSRWEQLNLNLATYIENPRFVGKYWKEVQAAHDSIIHSLPEKSPQYDFIRYQIAESEGKYKEAENYLSQYLKTLQPGTHEHAKKNYNMFNHLKLKGDHEEAIAYLIEAAISDVKDAIKENRALLDLSIWLYENNDIKRANRFIQYALNDANFYNARFRYFELAKALPIITDAYQQHMEKQTKRLLYMLLAISFLFIVLSGGLLYLQRQKKALAIARKGLDQTNRDLEKMNTQLQQLNLRLVEADRIKEEYIGHFIDLYSEYINKLDDYRKMINNKIAAKRFDELLKMTGTSGNKTDNVKELNINFDRAFLRIYPSFVDAFNELLKPEERFELKKEELNTELRVFALIRLGITDSNKIASFLRCSVQTVYNYRSKIKRKTINENEDIESLISRLQ